MKWKGNGWVFSTMNYTILKECHVKKYSNMTDKNEKMIHLFIKMTAFKLRKLDPVQTAVLIHFSFSKYSFTRYKVQFSRSAMSDSCNPMGCSTPSFPVHHHLTEFAQTHVNHVGDAIQPSHPLSSSFPPAFNLSQHQGLFQWVSSSHQMAKGLEFQLQHQSFQWTPRTDLL